jgi:hypothetical protein
MSAPIVGAAESLYFVIIDNRQARNDASEKGPLQNAFGPVKTLRVGCFNLDPCCTPVLPTQVHRVDLVMSHDVSNKGLSQRERHIEAYCELSTPNYHLVGRNSFVNNTFEIKSLSFLF